MQIVDMYERTHFQIIVKCYEYTLVCDIRNSFLSAMILCLISRVAPRFHASCEVQDKFCSRRQHNNPSKKESCGHHLGAHQRRLLRVRGTTWNG